MRIILALAASALLGGVAAEAAAPPVRPNIRLKSTRPQIYSYHATFSGSYIDSAGKRYDAIGDGIFLPVVIGDQPGLKYTVTITAFPHSYPYNVIEFGAMEGQGATQGTPDHITFDIQGTPNSNGYRLNVNGDIANGFIEGGFGISGNGGTGQGDLFGH